MHAAHQYIAPENWQIVFLRFIDSHEKMIQFFMLTLACQDVRTPAAQGTRAHSLRIMAHLSYCEITKNYSTTM
jgi:hypothetical protein